MSKPKRHLAVTRDLFKPHFDIFLNPENPLLVLADKINWARFEAEFDGDFGDKGAPAKPTRLMVGLHYIKYLKNMSDEDVVADWPQNPYWQYFCGFETFQHEAPCDPTTMTKWRNRFGADKFNSLLDETISIAKREKFVSNHELKHVTVDSTVQEKNIAHPTDSKLLYKCIVLLAKAREEYGVRIRQSYVRVAKKMALMASRYAHSKRFKKMHKAVKWLKLTVLRVVRDFYRKCTYIGYELQSLLDIATKIAHQERNTKDKVYSIHEPETKCISKGKARQKYEFGQKVSVATTTVGNWIVSCRLAEGNPYDGHTLRQTIVDVESVSGVIVTEIYLDRGYKGHDYRGDATVHIAGNSTEDLTKAQINRAKRRSAVEPKIGHLKDDNRMRRCFLKGLEGDDRNAVLSAAASNMKKLLNLIVGQLLLMLTKSLWWRVSGSHSTRTYILAQ